MVILMDIVILPDVASKVNSLLRGNFNAYEENDLF